jgi:hypothetical protein
LSFFLFVRDIAKGDLMQWIDQQLGNIADSSETLSSAARAQKRLIRSLLLMAIISLPASNQWGRLAETPSNKLDSIMVRTHRR